MPDNIKGQIDFFKSGASFKKKERYRKRFYHIPRNSPDGFDDGLLFDIVKQTGIQVLLFTSNCEAYIGKCLQSIESAMEGKKWVLIVADDNSEDRTFEIINHHRTGALYFVKEQLPAAGNTVRGLNQLFMLGKPFREAFPWICFVKDSDGMHPLRIDFLLPHAIQNRHRAVLGDCLLVNGDTGDCPPRHTNIVKATDIDFWRNNFAAGLYCILFHVSLARENQESSPENIKSIYDEMMRRHIAPYEDQIINVHNLKYDPEFIKEPVRFTMCRESADEIPKTGDPESNLESFSIVATRTLAEELLITLKSIRLYHRQPVYLICDSFVKDLVGRNQFDNLVVYDELNDDQLKEIGRQYFSRPYHEIWKYPPSQPNPPILLKKMDAMNYALQNHNNTLVMDADLIFLSPITRQFTEALVLSPEMNDYRVFIDDRGAEYFDGSRDRLYKKTGLVKPTNEYRHQLHDVFGIYNAGFLFTREKGFPGWWKENFLNGSKFLEQEAINRAGRDFYYGIFEEYYNYGFWKLWRLYTDEFRRNIGRRLGAAGRLKFTAKCKFAANSFFFRDYFDMLLEMSSIKEIAREMGFQSGSGVWLNGRRLQSFHLHIFYTSKHQNLISRWNFIKELALYLIGSSRDEKHRELYSYIRFLMEQKHGSRENGTS